MVMDYETERAKTDRGKCYYCKKPIPARSIKVKVKYGYRRMSMIQYTASLCAACGLKRLDAEKESIDRVKDNIVKGVATYNDYSAVIRKERKAREKWEADHTCSCGGRLVTEEELKSKVCKDCK